MLQSLWHSCHWLMMTNLLLERSQVNNFSPDLSPLCCFAFSWWCAHQSHTLLLVAPSIRPSMLMYETQIESWYMQKSRSRRSRKEAEQFPTKICLKIMSFNTTSILASIEKQTLIILIGLQVRCEVPANQLLHHYHIQFALVVKTSTMH